MSADATTSMPELTVVCVAGSQPQWLAGLLAALAAQTARERIEIVVARRPGSLDPVAQTPSRGTLDPVAQHPARGGHDIGAADGGEPPAQLRTVVAGPHVGAIRAAGVRAARAPLVAFLFDHCHPRPGWARAVIDGFTPHVSVVGYVFAEDREASYAARAAWRGDYAPWLESMPVRRTRTVAGQDVAYRRDDLLALGEDLDRRLDFDAFVCDALHLAGREATVAARAAVVRHAGLRRTIDNLRASHAYSRLVMGRLAAAGELGAGRRAAHAALLALGSAPLNLVRLAIGAVRCPSQLPSLLRYLPAIALFGLAAAAGLARGCLTGEGDAAALVTRIELDLDRGDAA